MSQQPHNTDELGALWIKKSSKTGSIFLTGTVSGVEVVIFRNDHKVEGSHQPDWRVLKSKPRSTTPPLTDDPFAPGTPDEDAPF